MAGTITETQTTIINTLKALPKFSGWNFYYSRSEQLSFPCIILDPLETNDSDTACCELVPYEYTINLIMLKKMLNTDSFKDLRYELEGLLNTYIYPNIRASQAGKTRHLEVTNSNKKILGIMKTITIGA